MKNIKLFTIFIFGSIFISSCLKGNLPELPAYTNAEITDLYSQYRYLGTAVSPDGNSTIETVNLSVSDKRFENNMANATVTVPDPGSFTVPGEWDKVSASGIVMMCNISTGATIVPVNGAPVLGTPGDYSKAQQYKVTAADGKTTKLWTISIALVK